MLWSPVGDYMLGVALVVTHFFWAKTDMPKKRLIVWLYFNSPNGYAPSNCTAILCKEGMVDSKSYCTVVKTHRDETSIGH